MFFRLLILLFVSCLCLGAAQPLYLRGDDATWNQKTYDLWVKGHVSVVQHLDDGTRVVGIDEAQFFDAGLVEVVERMATRGIRVVVAGLDMDYTGKPFGPMPHLLAIAEYVTKVHAICVETGQLAHYSHRIIEGDKQVQLGEKESYVPLSRAAFVKKQK